MVGQVNNEENMSISIRIGGRIASVYLHNNLSFIEGRKGSEYEIVVSNPFNVRVKAVLSVDGMNVITGEPCDYDDQGYVINPYGSITIDGWRISDAAVRAFKFGNDSESYGALSGQGVDNNGVIGVALFKERSYTHPRRPMVAVDSWPWNNAPSDFQPMWYSSNAVGSAVSKPLRGRRIPNWNAAMTLGASAADVDLSSIGTGQGQTLESRTTEVRFDYEKKAASVETVYYDTWEGLLRRGVVQTKISVPPLPNAFPANTKYAKSF